MDPLDEVDDPAQIITSLDNIVVQLQKHAEQLEAHHLDDALPALQSQQLQQHQQKPSTGCLQLHSHQAKSICVARGRHTDWKVCKTALPALLACCALFAQKLLHKGSYTRGPTKMATDNTVFRHSSPSCTKQELTLQLSLF